MIGLSRVVKMVESIDFTRDHMDVDRQMHFLCVAMRCLVPPQDLASKSTIT